MFRSLSLRIPEMIVMKVIIVPKSIPLAAYVLPCLLFAFLLLFDDQILLSCIIYQSNREDDIYGSFHLIATSLPLDSAHKPKGKTSKRESLLFGTIIQTTNKTYHTDCARVTVASFCSDFYIFLAAVFRLVMNC